LDPKFLGTAALAAGAAGEAGAALARQPFSKEENEKRLLRQALVRRGEPDAGGATDGDFAADAASQAGGVAGVDVGGEAGTGRTVAKRIAAGRAGPFAKRFCGRGGRISRWFRAVGGYFHLPHNDVAPIWVYLLAGLSGAAGLSAQTLQVAGRICCRFRWGAAGELRAAKRSGREGGFFWDGSGADAAAAGQGAAGGDRRAGGGAAFDEGVHGAAVRIPGGLYFGEHEQSNHGSGPRPVDWVFGTGQATDITSWSQLGCRGSGRRVRCWR